MGKKKKKAARKSRRLDNEALAKLLIIKAILELAESLLKLIDKLTD